MSDFSSRFAKCYLDNLNLKLALQTLSDKEKSSVKKVVELNKEKKYEPKKQKTKNKKVS